MLLKFSDKTFVPPLVFPLLLGKDTQHTSGGWSHQRWSSKLSYQWAFAINSTRLTSSLPAVPTSAAKLCPWWSPAVVSPVILRQTLSEGRPVSYTICVFWSVQRASTARTWADVTKYINNNPANVILKSAVIKPHRSLLARSTPTTAMQCSALWGIFKAIRQ